MLAALRRAPAPFSAVVAGLARPAPRFLHHDSSSPVVQQYVFVLGEPGAGKSTQCEKLVKEFGYSHISAGELLRRAIEEGSVQDTSELANTIDDGRIVPAHVRGPPCSARAPVSHGARQLDQSLSLKAISSPIGASTSTFQQRSAGDGVAAAEDDEGARTARLPDRRLPAQHGESGCVAGQGEGGPRPGHCAARAPRGPTRAAAGPRRRPQRRHSGNDREALRGAHAAPDSRCSTLSARNSPCHASSDCNAAFLRVVLPGTTLCNSPLL